MINGVYSMSEYLPRIIDKQIEKYLRVIGAILIIGPKWCGKTTTAMQHTNSMLKLQSNQKVKISFLLTKKILML